MAEENMYLDRKMRKSKVQLTKIVPRDRFIIKQIGQITGGTAPNDEAAISVESGGEVRNVVMGWDGSAIIRLLAEADGSLRTMNVGWDGSNEVRISTETSGEQKMTLYGKDSGSNIAPLRTNANQQLMAELYENWIRVTPVALTSSDAIILDGSTIFGATDYVFVEMMLYNFSSAAATVSVYIDLQAGGTAGNHEYLMNAEVLASKARVELPPILVLGEDDIRAFTAAGADVNVHFRIRKVRQT